MDDATKMRIIHAIEDVGNWNSLAAVIGPDRLFKLCGHLLTASTSEPAQAVQAPSDVECWEQGKPDSIDRAMAYESQERGQFEEWAIREGFNVHRDPTDEKYRDYHRATTRWAWSAWITRALLAARTLASASDAAKKESQP